MTPLGDSAVWVGNAIGGAALLVTFGGFVIAIKQLRLAAAQIKRTADEVETIKNTVNRTELRMGHNELITTMTQLRAIAKDLESAAARADRAESRADAAVALARWHEHASEVRGLVLGQSEFEPLVGVLQKSVTFVAQAKNDIIDNPSGALIEQVKHARHAVTDATEQLATVAGRLKRTSSELLR